MRSAARRAIAPDQALLPIGELAVVEPSRRRVPVRAHLRTVRGQAGPTGAERRDAALEQHESRAVVQQCVAYVRDELRALHASRKAASPDPSDHYVTADDVESVLRKWADCPDEAKHTHGPQMWRGTVFRGKGWRQTGAYVPSVRPHMNATALPCWEPVDPSTDENP
jgi:hypothetical protein